MNITKKDNLMKFDFYMPMYNWFYPYSSTEIYGGEAISFFNNIKKDVSNRSLYFHIPFCQDICSFCPFTRIICDDEEVFENYLDALEIEIKNKMRNDESKDFPVTAIFVGGGTPSILNPEQIVRFGKIIKDNFNLSELKEFSFEMNAKTVTEDRVKALRKIGVTHTRMGVQTFTKKYREIFKLSATIEQIKNGAKLLNENFDYVCVDLLYGMHGQTLKDFIYDLENIIELDTITIDIYPINNIVTQYKLDENYALYDFKPLSAEEKFSFNVFLREFMVNSGYLPHNGHGYIKASLSEISENKVYTEKYTFQYHETVYGYKGSEVLGFGAAAYSILDNGYSVGNNTNIMEYIDDLKNNQIIKCEIEKYDTINYGAKGIVLHLPYHGRVDKNKINLDEIPNDIVKSLMISIEEGLIDENETSYKLTKKGWYWYVNLLYYLSPKSDKKELLNRIQGAQKKGKIKKYEWIFGVNKHE